MSKIICIGSLAKDIFFPTQEAQIIDNPNNPIEKRLIAFEYGAKYQIEDRFEALGGCAANVSLGLAKLGLKVVALGRIGKDVLGDEILKTLENNKVDTNLVQIDEKAKSDLSLIIVNEKDGERTIFFNRDANENLEIKKENLRADYLIISALNGDWKNNMQEILSAAKENNSKIIYNPGQANMKENLEAVREFIVQSKILTLNLDEAIEILGEEDSAENLLRKLSDLGPEIVVITLGADGAIGIKNNEIKKIEGKKVEAKDSTGAGDAFNSAFLAAHILEKDFAECLNWGINNGASVVKFYGASQGLLDENKIKE